MFARLFTGNEEEDDDKPGGHVFCFLPLSLEQKSSTGLPVHVNGYFSISQNRRHLKWPTAGLKSKSDKVECALHVRYVTRKQTLWSLSLSY